MKIEKSIQLRAPRSRVWRALTKPEEFGKWFGVQVTQEFVPGERVKMLFEFQSKQIEGYLTVDRLEPEGYFSWRWHPGKPDPNVDYSKEPTTLVEFHLEEVEGGTLLKVIESGFEKISLARRAGVYGDNDGGWAAQLKNIERYVG